jgi:hypothetical protein
MRMVYSISEGSADACSGMLKIRPAKIVCEVGQQ